MSKTKVATTRRSRKKKAAPAPQKPTNGASGGDKLAEALQDVIALNPAASPRAAPIQAGRAPLAPCRRVPPRLMARLSS